MSRPSTILYVAWAPFFSGAERALLVLIDHLDRSRYRPIVVVGTDGQLAEELRSRHICTEHLPMERPQDASRLGRSRWIARFAWRAWRERAHLVHANDLPSFQPTGHACRLANVPAVCHVRFPDTRPGYEWFLKPMFARAVFISKDLQAGAMREAAHIFAGRSEVVYDGVQVPPLATDEQRRQVRQRLSLPPESVVVVLAGQIAEVKGLWEYIDAAQILARRGADVIFAILGDDLKNRGAVRAEAERVVNERGLAGTVRFLGFQPDAPSLMHAFDIVAVPSHIEPLGLAALEGMAASRPVVAASVGGLVETVVDGVTGTLVPVRDAVRLADAIEVLARDRTRARAYGEAGRRRVIEAFGVGAHVANIQQLYDQVLGHQPKPALVAAPGTRS